MDSSHLYQLLFILQCLVVVHAHICVWQPRQRGKFNIDIPDSDPCYRKVGPCGGVRASSAGRTKLKAGSRYTVKFQQNMNHYYTTNPGRMDVSFAIGRNPSEDKFRVLKSIDDYNPMNQVTQTNFSLSILLPNETCRRCVLRVRYLSQNPKEDDRGTTFYQCADIQLVANPQAIQATAAEEPKAKVTSPYDCCAPASFVLMFVHRIPETDFHSSGLIYYDKPSKQMAVRITSGPGQSTTIPNGVFAMWMNFTSGLQSYQNVNENSCYSFGLDFFNEWCFGNTYNQSSTLVASNVPCTSQIGTCHQWRNGDFLFEAFADTCYPAAISRQSSKERKDFYVAIDGPFNKSIFRADPSCFK